MEAPTAGTPKRKAPPLLSRLGAMPLPAQRPRIGVVEGGASQLLQPEHRQRIGSAVTPFAMQSAAHAVAPARGDSFSPPRRRIGSTAPPALSLPSRAVGLAPAVAGPHSDGTPERAAPRIHSSGGDLSHAGTPERPPQGQSVPYGGREAEAEALLSSGSYGVDHDPYSAGDEEAPYPKLCILSAMIVRPVLEGDHVEYEIETSYSMHDGADGELGIVLEPDPEPEPQEQSDPVGATSHSQTGQKVLTSLVMRRYSKFEVLRKLIIKRFPDLPKLPKKGFRRHGGVENIAELERVRESQSQTELRASARSADPRVAGLNAFLEALIATEGASQDGHVQQFLGLPEVDILDHGIGEHHATGGADDTGANATSMSHAAGRARVRTWSGGLAEEGDHCEGVDLRQSQVNRFESDGYLSRQRSSYYVPREERNIGQHAVHSVAKKAGRGIEAVGIARRSAPPSVPRRVREMLGVDESALGADGSFQHMHRASAASAQYLADAMRAQRATVSGDTTSEVVKVVDLWSCYVKLERDGEGHFATFLLYAVYWGLLMMVFFDGPSSSWSLAQNEAISDLLFDEEFEEANYKKNWHEVMTAEELYTWIEGPLTNALYDVELGQNSSLLGGSTHLVGQVEFRQARSTGGNGPGCVDNSTRTNCPTEFGDFGEVSDSLVPGGQCASSWHIPEYVSAIESLYDNALNWEEPIYRGGAVCDQQDDNETLVGNVDEADGASQSRRPELVFGQDFKWRKHSQPIEGSKSFVRKPMGATNPLAGNPYNYGEGTYSTTWPRDYRAWREKLDTMRGEGGTRLIDQHTRALAISMVLYNGNSFSYSRFNSSEGHDTDMVGHTDGRKDVVNSDQLIYVQAVVEIDPGGHYEKHTKVLPIRPMRAISDPAEYNNRWLHRTIHGIFGRFLWREDAYSEAFLVLALLTLLVEVRKIISEGLRGYFILSSSAAWNKFEMVVWCMLFSTLVQGSSFQKMSDAALKQLAQVEVGPFAHELSTSAGVEAAHMLIDQVADLRVEHISLRRHVAWLLFLSTLKVMKFMNLSERLSFLWRVLGHAKVELLAFLGIFLVLLSSFALLATTLMGYNSRTLHNVPTTMLSLLRLTVGTFDLNYDEWHRADPIWAPVFLVSFIFLLILVAANIFIAILTDAYSTKKAQIAKYTRFKKLLRKEGVLLTSNSAAGMFKRLYRTLFPHWRLQVPAKLWPRPKVVDVEATYKIHPFCAGGGADLVTLHFHHESIVGGDPEMTLAKVGEMSNADDSVSSSSNKDKDQQRIDLMAQTNKQVGITLASAAEVLPTEEEEQQERAQPLDGRNALHGSKRACYLQLAQDLYMEDLPLLIALMRQGEVVELRGNGQQHGNRCRIKLQMMEVFTRKRTIPRVGGEPEHSKDWYANFKVIDVKSWESFTPEKATQLLLDTRGWSAQQDRLILDNMRLKRQYDLARDKAVEAGDASLSVLLNGKRPQSVSKLAEQLDKTTDEIRSRQQYVKRCADAGLTPPPVLASTLHWSTRTSLKLWYRAWMNDDLPHYSVAGFVLPRLHKLFLTKSGVERDVDDFLRGRIGELKRKHNMRDLESVRRSFTKHSIDVDEFVNHLQLFLYTTRRRTLAYLRQTYSNPMYTRWLLVYLQTEYKEQIASVRRKKRRDIPTPPPH